MPAIPEIPSGELVMHRRITAEFISASQVVLALTPRSRVRTASGGWTWVTGTTRPLQNFKLIEPREPASPITTADGVVRRIDFEILGNWNAVMEVGDVFNYDGAQWEIIELYPFNGWEMRGVVVRRNDGSVLT